MAFCTTDSFMLSKGSRCRSWGTRGGILFRLVLLLSNAPCPCPSHRACRWAACPCCPLPLAVWSPPPPCGQVRMHTGRSMQLATRWPSTWRGPAVCKNNPASPPKHRWYQQAANILTALPHLPLPCRHPRHPADGHCGEHTGCPLQHRWLPAGPGGLRPCLCQFMVLLVRVLLTARAPVPEASC